MLKYFTKERVYNLALNPWMVLGCLLVGGALGLNFPEIGKKLGVVGSVYVDLLKMIVLPFMMSAVIFSLQRLFREGGATTILGRVAWVFLVFSLATTLVAAVSVMAIGPGTNISETERQGFGAIVGNDLDESNTEMSLKSQDAAPKTIGFKDVLASLVPSNIFSSLANGEALKALVFALLFGFAVGQVPSRISEGLSFSLETIYHSCQTLTKWLNYPLPIVLLCMSASQLAESGMGPLKAMTDFVIAFSLIAVVLSLGAILVIRNRSGASFSDVLKAIRDPFALAVATRSSPTCMPMMIEALADKLQFARSRVELLVPLGISLLRVGPMIYYASATIFIAQLYERPLTGMDIGIVTLASILAGFASAGMTGLVTVSLVGMTCGYLGLPFEAAFILFVAIDPICDMLRTVVQVIVNSAAVSLICPKPLKV